MKQARQLVFELPTEGGRRLGVQETRIALRWVLDQIAAGLMPASDLYHCQRCGAWLVVDHGSQAPRCTCHGHERGPAPRYHASILGGNHPR